MGKKWDYQVPSVEIWREVFRVLKPGAHLLSFGGTRTYHRMVVNIEDAGFEIRDSIMWHYGSGFPKSLDVTKAIQGLFCREFLEDVSRSIGIDEDSQGRYSHNCHLCGGSLQCEAGGDQDELHKQDGAPLHTHPSLPLEEMLLDISHRYRVSYGALSSRLSKQDSAHHEGESSFLIVLAIAFALCPPCFSQLINGGSFDAELPNDTDWSKISALSFLLDEARFQTLCRTFRISPLPYNQYIAGLLNVKGFGTALKPATEIICLARKPLEGTVADNVLKWGTGALNIDACRIEGEFISSGGPTGFKPERGWHNHNMKQKEPRIMPGRFPSNVILDGSEEVMGLFPVTGNNARNRRGQYGGGSFGGGLKSDDTEYNDSGSASRFFYCAKASRKERNSGLDGMEETPCGMMEDDNYPIKTGSGNLRNTKRQNHHPTVKPVDLIRYLCRLITPPKGIILDPFAGSGTLGLAATDEGFHYVLIEKEAEFHEISVRRNQAGPLFEAAL